ncbi:MAG: hypothetical protein DRJ03_17065 [Chloroflexi bacterium]|nr:MAG: hypothetical protein DRJ03_17065 [Chloroflexota bacterium]
MFKAVILDDDGENREVVEEEVQWKELDPTRILQLALCNEKGEILALVDRPEIDAFQEFVQYKTAHAIFAGGGSAPRNTTVVAQAGGWTDGIHEYVLILDLENERICAKVLPRTHYHPASVDRPKS